MSDAQSPIIIVQLQVHGPVGEAIARCGERLLGLPREPFATFNGRLTKVGLATIERELLVALQAVIAAKNERMGVMPHDYEVVD